MYTHVTATSLRTILHINTSGLLLRNFACFINMLDNNSTLCLTSTQHVHLICNKYMHENKLLISFMQHADIVHAIRAVILINTQKI